MSERRRFALSCNPDGKIRCLDCGELAHYMVVTYGIDNSNVLKKAWYCEGCCN